MPMKEAPRDEPRPSLPPPPEPGPPSIGGAGGPVNASLITDPDILLGCIRPRDPGGMLVCIPDYEGSKDAMCRTEAPSQAVFRGHRKTVRPQHYPGWDRAFLRARRL